MFTIESVTGGHAMFYWRTDISVLEKVNGKSV